jgi:hypothetical protein
MTECHDMFALHQSELTFPRCPAPMWSAHASNESPVARAAAVRTPTGRRPAPQAGTGMKAPYRSTPTKPVGRPYLAPTASHNQSTGRSRSQLGRSHTASRRSTHYVPIQRPTKITARRRGGDGIFITRLPVGLWHKLGTQSAKRKRGEGTDIPRLVSDRRGRRRDIGVTVACSLAADDYIVCSFDSRSSRLRRRPQPPVGRRYDGSPVRQRWNGGTHL